MNFMETGFLRLEAEVEADPTSSLVLLLLVLLVLL